MATSAEDVLVALHAEHGRGLWGYVLRLTGGDRARAEDVVQETLIRAWRHPEVLSRPPGAVRSWLFTVSRHLVIDQWRAGHEVAVEDPPEPTGVADTWTDEVLNGWIVADALTRLTPEHRQVVVLCYFRGLSVAEVARLLGVPDGTVKSRTHYALRALRLALEEKGVTR
ncbi:sigma-70 family RNA polymerase sigma factor [Actinotalea sp. M2MS4P-6]|uniref:sigma-70 family RNA polymerase sigma factor n=1 Tax=Actinotalea sp. M2MS4P-6 TaxID=2983762 RepID=UPI0021E437B2|nr:sigma-70 family RNA polymerase sigma factor [Actinotalea sp. M2MS4P-6]MCV2395258.1 sigma-70 family RNA polymerase sigma factor [Actinotalea sp. M2MS4P-6]